MNELYGVVFELEELLSEVKFLKQLVPFKEGEKVELHKGFEASLV